MSLGQVATTAIARSEPAGVRGPARYGQHSTAGAMSQDGVAVDVATRALGKVTTECAPDSLDDVRMVAGFEVRIAVTSDRSWTNRIDEREDRLVDRRTLERVMMI